MTDNNYATLALAACNAASL